MPCRNIIILFISFFVFADLNSGYAADTLMSRVPIAVLVQLRSEHNRITALAAAGKHAAVEEVKKDASGVAAAMISDFRDHFTFCPVYYYMDSNVDLIKKRMFDGVLMNADGAPAKNIVMNNSGKKYFIVYYGYPASQSKTKKVVKDPDTYEYDSGEPMGKGLIIDDSNFHQVSFFYKFGFDERSFKRKDNQEYYYQAKHYDMEYFPFAGEFDKALREHRKKRIRHL